MGDWNNLLLLGSALLALGVAGLLLCRDGRAALVSLSIGWLGLPVLIAAARLLHPEANPAGAIIMLLAVLAAYLALGAGLRRADLQECEIDDADRDRTGPAELAGGERPRDWSTELTLQFQPGAPAAAGPSGGDERLP